MQRRRPNGGRRSQGGQAVLETAVVAPLLVAIVLGVAAVGYFLHAYLGLSAAVREAARTVATSEMPGSTDAANEARARAADVASSFRLDPSRLQLDPPQSPDGFQRGGAVRVTGRYTLTVPFVGSPEGQQRLCLSPLPLPCIPFQATLSVTHTERIERFRSRQAEAPVPARTAQAADVGGAGWGSCGPPGGPGGRRGGACEL